MDDLLPLVLSDVYFVSEQQLNNKLISSKFCDNQPVIRKLKPSLEVHEEMLNILSSPIINLILNEKEGKKKKKIK